ncbi:MAG TPA: helix-turn-helix domain-containing protein [Acidothermaceae bacterium]
MTPVFVDVSEAQAALGGIGRTKIAELIASGELTSVKLGRRRLIPFAALEAFAAKLCA